MEVVLSNQEKQKPLSSIQTLIGNYHAFFSDLLYRMKQIGLDITGMPMSHLLYRTTALSEYYHLRDELKKYCSEFVETQFNDRAVSILILSEPLLLEGGFTVSMIELPAPRPAHMYPSGLESIGVVLGKELPAFIQKHKHVLTGVRDHGQHCQPAFVTFANDKTAKFYDISLREIVILQGWEITTCIPSK
jgi:predicted metalloenzyme YecM